MNKRLLIITRHRLSENNGGANGSKGFIHCFAALFNDCSIIYPAFDDTARFIPSSYKLFPYVDVRTKLRKGIDAYRGLATTISVFARQHLAAHSYDVVVVDHSFIGTSALLETIKASGARLITIHHNVERDYLRDNAHQFSLAFRLPYIHFAKKAERDCLENSDVNLTVTKKDAATFRAWYGDRNLHIHNWGNFEYRRIEDKSFGLKKKGQHFIITGSLSFMQSLYPIMDFVQRYWPLVTKDDPTARLTIAGRNPQKALKRLCEETTGVSLIANPDDMVTLVQQADYYVCPISSGSGRKLRVLDGLKQGLPVLCHEVSLSGYEEMVECGCMFGYHDEATFYSSLHQMLTSPVSPGDVYQAYQSNFSVEAGVARLRTILQQERII